MNEPSTVGWAKLAQPNVYRDKQPPELNSGGCFLCGCAASILERVPPRGQEGGFASANPPSPQSSPGRASVPDALDCREPRSRSALGALKRDLKTMNPPLVCFVQCSACMAVFVLNRRAAVSAKLAWSL
jgi:hypothetical protein